MFGAGEVSLPGGKAEDVDVDDGATAMREAEEEIGLDRGLVNVVTVLEPFLSKVWLEEKENNNNNIIKKRKCSLWSILI